LLEDSIQVGVEYLLRNVKSVQDKKLLDSSSDKFNQMNSDFQENWNDEFWRCYQMIKGGKKQNKGIKPDLNTRVADLQDLASTLNKSIKDEKKEETGKTEESVTAVTNEPEKSNGPDPVARKCCNCEVF
jgi:non-homologous end joining protein Ku